MYQQQYSLDIKMVYIYTSPDSWEYRVIYFDIILQTIP